MGSETYTLLAAQFRKLNVSDPFGFDPFGFCGISTGVIPLAAVQPLVIDMEALIRIVQ